MSNNYNSLPSYIPSLDGIRAVAVLLVVIAHAGFGHIVPGGFGVTIFFFLSGFLITTLLEKEFRKTDNVSIKHFFLRRFFRLFPPLFAVLILSYSLAATKLIDGGVSLPGFLYQLFYLANYNKIFYWDESIPQGLGILWSLAVEEHFYIFFPTIFLLLRKFGGVKAAVTFVVSLCVLVLLWRLYLVYGLDMAHRRIYYGTDTRIDSILYGCLFALVFSPFNKAMDAETKIDSKFWLLMGAGSGLILFSLLYRDESFRETFRYTIQGIGLMPFFYYAVALNNHKLFSWLNFEFMKKLGVYSYSIYLIHFVLTGIVVKYELTQSNWLHFIYVIVVSVIFAYIIDKYVDNYFRKLRKQFRD